MAAPSPRRSPYLPVAALVLLALIWGYNWVGMKVGVSYSDPFTFAACATSWAPLTPGHGGRPARLAAAQALLAHGSSSESSRPACRGLSIWALYIGSAGKTSVLTYTMPFWLLLFAWPILGEQYAAPVAHRGSSLAGLILVLTPGACTG